MSAWANTSRSRSRCSSRPTICDSAWRTGPASSPSLARVLAGKQISLEAVLQLPSDNWRDLPFVITVEPDVGTIHSRGAGRDVDA